MMMDQGVPEAMLRDAAHFPGGHAAGVVYPRTTAEVADILVRSASVLPIGAQSSLTGGATPMGELLMSTSKMTRVISRNVDQVTVEAGLSVAALQEELAETKAWFPPAPTFTGASAGGIVSTNAAGAATFKYGATRGWVEGLVVVLADGTILDLKRGDRTARDGRMLVETNSGPVAIPVPSYTMPDVPKRSAGYYARPDMDLIDLFVGADRDAGRCHSGHVSDSRERSGDSTSADSVPLRGRGSRFGRGPQGGVD